MKAIKNRAGYLVLPAFVLGFIAIWVIWRERFGVQHTAPVITRQAVSASLVAKDAYGKLPLRFEANRGQADDQVLFLSRGSGYSLFLTATETIFRMRNADGMRNADRGSKPGNLTDPSSIFSTRSSIFNPQSLISNPRSLIPNPQSAIRNPQRCG